MRRKSRNLSLVLVPVLLAACGAEVPDQQRDVYARYDDCMADWGKPELCQQMPVADAQEFAQQTTGVPGGGGAHTVFWGPSYYPGDRVVGYNGQTFAPDMNRAMSRPFAIRSTSSASAHSSPATARATSVSRGGFGGAGAHAGGSSGG